MTKNDYDYNINSRIKIQARKEGQNKENVWSQVVAMIANCPPMYTDVYERQQKMNLYPWTTSLMRQ